MRKIVLGAALLAVISVFPTAGWAAGADGKYSVKDAGLQTCSLYLDERKVQSKRYGVFRGWLMGYISAYNRLAPDTLDIAPWQTSGLLDQYMFNFCTRNPTVPFVQGVETIVDALVPNRLKTMSETFQIQSASGNIVMYRSILMRVQQKLAELGHYTGTIDGQFGPATNAALQAYQKSKSLDVTGIPDQVTLHNLFN